MQHVHAIDSDRERAEHRTRAGQSTYATRDAARAERARDAARAALNRDRIARLRERPDDVSVVGREMFGYDGLSPDLLAVARRAIATVARTYPGLDTWEIESRALRLIGIGLSHMPTTDKARVYGRARYAAKRVASRLKTGRGAMPVVHDGERQPGSPNNAVWIALDEDGVPVTIAQTGAGVPHYLAQRGMVPGESSLSDAIAQRATTRDAAAALLALEHAYVYSRDRAVVARGSVVIDWRAAFVEYVRLTGDRVSIDTFRRRVRRALVAATADVPDAPGPIVSVPYGPIMPAPIRFVWHRVPGPGRGDSPYRDGHAGGLSDHWDCVSGTCAACGHGTTTTRAQWTASMVSKYGDRPGFAL